MTNLVKYPRTPHVPTSPGVSSDDVIANLEMLSELVNNHPVLITEKMDGECTTMYTDHIHARSLTSGYHPSRTRVKQLHSVIAHQIPEGWRVCGENMQAVHSIKYSDLADWFLVYSIWNDQNKCLDWNTTLEWIDLLELQSVPVLYSGNMSVDQIHKLHKELDLSVAEGYVIRNAESFKFDDFDKNVFKWVRQHHVQTDAHWMSKPMIENRLRLL